MQAYCAPLITPCGAHAHCRDGKRPHPVKEFCRKLLKTHSPFTYTLTRLSRPSVLEGSRALGTASTSQMWNLRLAPSTLLTNTQ